MSLEDQVIMEPSGVGKKISLPHNKDGSVREKSGGFILLNGNFSLSTGLRIHVVYKDRKTLK